MNDETATAHREPGGKVPQNGLTPPLLAGEGVEGRGLGKSIDKEAIKLAVVDLIGAIGEDVDREGLADTPRRIADMYEEIFQGLQQDPREVLKVGFEERHEEMVIVRDIPFYSLCEHHFMPFFG